MASRISCAVDVGVGIHRVVDIAVGVGAGVAVGVGTDVTADKVTTAATAGEPWPQYARTAKTMALRANTDHPIPCIPIT